MTGSSCMDIELTEGGSCPICGGVIHLQDIENCSCHILPPCSACVSAELECSECGITQGDLEEHDFIAKSLEEMRWHVDSEIKWKDEAALGLSCREMVLKQIRMQSRAPHPFLSLIKKND